MSSPMNDGDAAVSAWLQDGPELGPVEGLEEILSETRAVRQRPARTFPSHWLPMSLDRGPGALRRPTPLLVVLVLAAVIAAVVIAIAVGLSDGCRRRSGSRRTVRSPTTPGTADTPFSRMPTGGIHGGSRGRASNGDRACSPDGIRIVYFSRPFDFPGTGAVRSVRVSDLPRQPGRIQFAPDSQQREVPARSLRPAIVVA